MKIQCSVENLKSAVLEAERVTGKNLTLPILSSLFIYTKDKSFTIRATNLSLGIEVEIPAKIEKEGSIAVSGGTLAALIATLNPKEYISLTTEGENLLLQTKTNHTLIKTYPQDDFPTIPKVEGETFTIDSGKFLEGLKAVTYSAALTDIKPEIAAVYIYSENDMLIFVATDSFRLAEKKIKQKNLYNFPPLLIPQKNIIELIRILENKSGDLTLVTSKNQVSFSIERTYLSSRVLTGLFPDYRQIVPKTFTTEAVVLKQDLSLALKAGVVFADKFSQITLEFTPTKKSALLKAKNTDRGEQETKLSAALTGEEVSVNINYRYLTDSFQSIGADSISFSLNGSQKAIVLRGVSDQSFMYLIMPMNR